MNQKSVKDPPKAPTESDDSTTRREFFRKSVYAVYATPLITALLVENASAARSNACKHTDRPWFCRE